MDRVWTSHRQAMACLVPAQKMAPTGRAPSSGTHNGQRQCPQPWIWSRGTTGGRNKTPMMTSIRATTIFALVLTTAIVGCARRPAVMSMATPPPVDSSVTPPGAGSDPTVLVIEERRDENIVAERPAPAAFSDNRN